MGITAASRGATAFGVATVGASGVVGGRAARITDNLFSGRDGFVGVFDPGSMALDAALAVGGTFLIRNAANRVSGANTNHFTAFLPKSAYEPLTTADLEAFAQKPVAKAPIQKFRDYIFKQGATHGKDKVFRSLGYEIDDSAMLTQIYEEQGLARYVNNDYVLGKLDEHGQRISIEIVLHGIRGATGKTSYLISGWMITDEGIHLNTPFSGFAR